MGAADCVTIGKNDKSEVVYVEMKKAKTDHFAGKSVKSITMVLPIVQKNAYCFKIFHL